MGQWQKLTSAYSLAPFLSLSVSSAYLEFYLKFIVEFSVTRKVSTPQQVRTSSVSKKQVALASAGLCMRCTDGGVWSGAW